ncbi:MAG: DUF4956 domain-containing protein [Candidatus Marinimicrobia bacterium]|nr:DUF4956 domain-containing protein [Candidatus Neomarinimicrobiota bacterium]|tara:strand:+ start:1854 stop:2534 length:681 start_codon:yes stop_codon:yes gene_type:complete
MEAIEKILVNYETNIPAFSFVINFIVATILSAILSILFRNYSLVLSNKEIFSKNLIIISTTTMLIITIVKSSLALSLGLVGALSIIRFRTAIKEPEELSYIFIAIAIGLGLGADQLFITIIAFFLTSVLIYTLFYFSGYKVNDKNMYLSIECDQGSPLNVDQLSSIINKSCSFLKLRRYEVQKDYFEAIFLIQLIDKKSLTEIQESLKNLNKSIKINFLNQDNPLM